MTKFMHSQQLMGSLGLSANTAYNAGAKEEALVTWRPDEILQLLKDADPAKNCEAVHVLIAQASMLAKWSEALTIAARKAMDEVDVQRYSEEDWASDHRDLGILEAAAGFIAQLS